MFKNKRPESLTTLTDEHKQLFMTNASFVGTLSFQLARSVSAITKDCLRELFIFHKKEDM